MPYDAADRAAKAAARVEAAKRQLEAAEKGLGYVVNAVRRLDASVWEFADAIAETHPITTAPGSSANSGDHAAMTLTAKRIADETGVNYSLTTLRTYRATSAAWSRDSRLPRAPFDVHRLLRGREDRSAVMTQLAAKSKDGHITQTAARAWVAQHTSTTRKTAKPGSGSWEKTVARFIARNCPDDNLRRRAIELIAQGATFRVKILD